jgi:galactan endo-1,6-beta-galactosidase
MLCAVFVSAVLVSAAPAQEKYVKIVQVDTGKVLAVADDSDEAGARAVVARDGDGKAQQWRLVKDGEFYKIVNRKSGKVLDVSGESLDEDGEIIQWDDKDEGTDNQRWSWQGDGQERRLKSKSSGLVLDVDGAGKIIQKKADPKSKAQLWKVVEVK